LGESCAGGGAGACAVLANDGLGKHVVEPCGGMEEDKPYVGEGERWHKHPVVPTVQEVYEWQLCEQHTFFIASRPFAAAWTCCHCEVLQCLGVAVVAVATHTTIAKP
jgi:hypothetical protein